MRDLLTTALELLGLASVVAGAWLVYLPAGLVTLGVSLLALAWLQERPGPAADR